MPEYSASLSYDNFTIDRDQLLNELHQAVLQSNMRLQHDNGSVVGALFDAATEYISPADAVEMLRDDGVEELAEQTFRRGRDMIDERMESVGVSYPSSFRAAVDNWPEVVGVYFAHWLLNEDHPDTENEDRLRGFVDDNIERHDDLLAAEFSDPFDSNPFDRLAYSEALSYTIAALEGFDVDDESVIDVYDHDSFRENCRQHTSLQDAIDADQYGDAIHSDLQPQLAPPENWPDSMNPRNPRELRCDFCGTFYVEVYTDRGKRLAHDMELHEPTNVFDDPSIHVFDETIPETICEPCVVRCRDNRTTYHIITSDSAVELASASGMALSLNGEPIDEIDETILDRVFNPGSDTVFIDEANFSREAVAIALDESQAVANSFDDGSWLAIRQTGGFGEDEFNIMIDTTDFHSVSVAKQIRDGNFEVVA